MLSLLSTLIPIHISDIFIDVNMSVAIFVNILEGLLYNNVSHVLRIFRVKEGCELLNVKLSTVVKIGHRPAPLVTCFHLLIRESMFFLLSIFFIKEPIDILPVLLPTDGVLPIRLVTGPLALHIIIHIPGLSELNPLGKFVLTDNPICILVNPVHNDPPC